MNVRENQREKKKEDEKEKKETEMAQSGQKRMVLVNLASNPTMSVVETRVTETVLICMLTCVYKRHRLRE